MKDTDKTKEPLIGELVELRRKNALFEESKIEKKYQELVENLPDFIVRFDSAGRIIFANRVVKRSLEKLFGLRGDGYIGKTYHELGFPDDLCYFWEQSIRSVAETGEPFETEYTYETADGPRWFAWRLIPESEGTDGRFKTIVSISRDITDHKRVEEVLEQRTHNLGERVKELDCLYGISGLVLKQDITIDEIIQGTIDLIPTSWQYPEITCARTVVDGQKFETVPFRKTSWKQCSKIKIHGKPAGILEVYYLEERPEIYEGPFLKEERKLIDAVAERMGRIIEQKRAETALGESEGKFSILSEQSQLGIAIIQNGLFKFANIAFSKIVGCSMEEILLWKTGDFTRLADPSPSLEQEQEEINRQIQINTRGGEIKWLEFYAKNIRYSGRKAEMITIIDITGKKKAEEKARQQQQQLIQLDKLASLGTLVAGVAHEINNPNQTIMANANRIIEAWKSIVPILEEYYEENGDFLVGGLNYSRMRKQMPVYQRGISEGAKSIGLIVNDLKNFARQENYERHEEININRVVNSSVALASDYIKKATKRLTVEIEENLPTIKGNFQRLEQVMINLIQNACQALQDNEQGILITTSFDQERDYVEVKVRDDGAGIELENLARIKDPFFTTKRGAGGMGLGLSISATIIEDHQGSLTITSERWKGTTATICLPVIPREGGPQAKQDP